MPNNEDTQVAEERKQPEITLVEDNTAAEPPPGDDAAIAGDSGAGDLINVGKFAWDVIKDNRPVASQSSDNANAVPQAANFTDLSGWGDEPRRMKLKFHSEDITGLNPTDINITCEWYFNGRWNGSGQYVNAATVYADINAAFGNTYQIQASIRNPLNGGESGNVVAVLPFRVTIQESNFGQNRTYNWSGQMKGNGAGYLRPE
jgi:hypothetical protein